MRVQQCAEGSAVRIAVAARARIAPTFVVIVAAVVGVSAAHAQAPRRELTLDVRPWSADIALAWRVSAGHMWGFAVGGGPDDFNHTFSPDVSPTSSDYVTLEQIVRFGPFYRYESGRRVNADVGLRFALGGVRGISGSPGAVYGLTGGVFAGTRHVRAGPRLFVGRSHEGGSREGVVHIDWLTAHLRLPF